jgi:hypothetical protein
MNAPFDFNDVNADCDLSWVYERATIILGIFKHSKPSSLSANLALCVAKGIEVDTVW